MSKAENRERKKNTHKTSILEKESKWAGAISNHLRQEEEEEVRKNASILQRVAKEEFNLFLEVQEIEDTSLERRTMKNWTRFLPTISYLLKPIVNHSL